MHELVHTLDMTNTLIPEFPVSYRVRLALEVSGVTEAQAAEYLQVHINTIHNYTSGRRRIRRPALIAISQLTGVDLAWLEGGQRGGPVTQPVTLRKPHHGRSHHLTIIHGKHREPHAITGELLRLAG